MANVISISARRRTNNIKKTTEPSTAGFSFTEEVNKDILKLRNNLNVTEEEAVKIATDFYRKYPMLIEYVRDANHLLGGR
ncbi:hypothetical protein D1872_51530 [compost metagenome]